MVLFLIAKLTIIIISMACWHVCVKLPRPETDKKCKFYAVDGGEMDWVKVGSFVMLEGSHNYTFDNRLGGMLNASWPSKLCL